MSDIVEFLTKSIENISGRKIDNSSEELIRSGIIDSFGILQLIMTLEAELGIKLEDHDLDSKNFASIKSIINMICKKDQAIRDHNDYSTE